LAEAGRRILIVQEDAIEAGLIAFHLKQADMTALVVTSTQEAWDAIGWGPPEVIVTELKTENIDGLEVVGGLVGKEVAAFLISDGVPTPEEELEALDRGVREIFTKPIDHRILAQRVARAELRVMEEGDASETAPIRGWLEDHNMTSLLDMCRRLSLNARLSVDLPNGESGHLVIREGRVIDGVRGDRAGREAVFTVMTLATGRFTLTPVLAEDPLLEGVDRVRMDLATLLEAAVQPRDRTGTTNTSPRTARRPRTKTGLTTLDEILGEEGELDDPATIISPPPSSMPVPTAEPSAGPSTTRDAISTHVAVDLQIDNPDTDAYAPTYVSDRPLEIPNTLQRSGPDSDILKALAIDDDDAPLIFPDDDLTDSLPTGPVEEDPSTAGELVGGIVPADPFSSTADAFKAITNEDLAALDDMEDDPAPIAPSTNRTFTQNELVTGHENTDPYSSTEEAFKALTRDDIERASREALSRPLVDPTTSDDDGDLDIEAPSDVDPLDGRSSSGAAARQTQSDYGELRPKSGLLQQSEIDELDGAFFDDDDDDDDDEVLNTRREDVGETPPTRQDEEDEQAAYETAPIVPRLEPMVHPGLDPLAADAPMEHSPGPETLGAIEAAMPGYGRSRWMGRALLIGLSLLFLGLGGLVVSKLMARGTDTSPAAGLSTAEPTEASEDSGDSEGAADSGKTIEEQVSEQYGRGNLAAKEGQLDAAMDHYRSALKLNPDHAGALAGLSAALLKEKRYEDAKPMLEELLRVAPDEGPAHLTLGLIAHKLNEPDDRTKALKAFMDLVPNSPHRAKLLELITGGKAEEGDDVVGAE